MKRLIKLGLSVLFALALAEEFTCRGALGAVTVDNPRVLQNGSCKFNGTTVKGTIKVENGATLTASRISVIGNIQAEGVKAVNVTSSSEAAASRACKAEPPGSIRWR